MCGICGIMGHLRPGDAEKVSKARCALTHRGPDGHGEWSSADEPDAFGAVFGHTRLSIIDLREAASQPMMDDETGVCLTYNGEIYNYKEIRRDLEAIGHVFRTRSDTEVVLRAYLEWEEGCVAKFRGMFAFAIYHPQRRRGLIARDGFGIKPLYIAQMHEGKAFVFSSELRALLKSEFVSPDIDMESLRHYIWNGFVPSPGTILRGVTLFPPGCYAAFDDNGAGLQITEYWNTQRSQAVPVTREQAAQETAETVRSHLVADVPVGVFLSGGIDSSAVACMASEAGQKVQTLSIGFDEAQSDETEYAEAVAGSLGTQHQTVVLTAAEMLENIDATVASLDQPTFDGINNWFVSRVAIESGLKVALAGTGGDELFGGYRSFERLPRLKKIAKALSWTASVSSLIQRLGVLPPYSSLAKITDIPSTRGNMAELYQLQYALFTRSAIDSFIQESPGPNGDEWGLDASRLRSLSDSLEGQTPLRQLSVLESHLFLSDRLLRDTDAVSMDHGLEIRVPFVDTGLWDCLAGLSDDDRFSPVGSKSFLRDILAKRLDMEIFNRPKRGFEFPFDKWMHGPLREEVSRFMEDDALCREIGLQPEAVRRLWRAYLDKPDAVYWTRVWAIYVLLHWCSANGVRCNR